MNENYDLVNRGQRLLHMQLAGYIGQKLNRAYGSGWWNEVLSTVNEPRDLPADGEYGELIDSLDMANCLRLLTRRWSEVFRNELPRDALNWANELMGVRNRIAHIGNQDMDRDEAYRALDTMWRMSQLIAPDEANEIKALRDRLREAQREVGLAQPATASVRGALTEGSLLQLIGTDTVERTSLSRKVTYGGQTVVYPVYRVRLDALYYNDQNDRIATWISQYCSEHGTGALDRADVEAYNNLIENFIVESNPESIQRTQKNISLVGQREPGVTLADGRVVDGNRRFTCLRRLSREQNAPLYFETVLMDMDIQQDKKQIKMLELSIQHGEEKKVDYDLIDYAVGTYRDVVQTGLLTVEEYASGTGESVAEVKKRIEIVRVIDEFLDYLRLPEQYHVARDFQVYSLFQEMMAPLRQLDAAGQKKLKTIAFHNAMLKAMPDQRRFIREIKGLIRSGNCDAYFAEQEKLGERLREDYDAIDIRSKADVERFAAEHAGLAEEMQASMERALQRSRVQQVKAKASETVEKCIDLLLDVDTRHFARLNDDEKQVLQGRLNELSRIAGKFSAML